MSKSHSEPTEAFFFIVWGPGAMASPEVAAGDRARARLAQPDALSAPELSAGGYEGWARVVRVVDGDTVVAVIDLPGGGLFRAALRLAGVDAPELRSRDPELRALAARARDRLAELCGDRVVWCRCEGRDRYGRALARLQPGGPGEARGVAETLADEGLARGYAGRGPRPWG
jgi:micrococcal nuclease